MNGLARVRVHGLWFSIKGSRLINGWGFSVRVIGLIVES
jgi:hypothetical protein